MTGGLLPPVLDATTRRSTTCVVVACPSKAVNVAVEVPVEVGVQLNAPVEVEKVAPTGIVVVTTSGSLSGSMIETVKVIVVETVVETKVGPVMTGGLFPGGQAVTMRFTTWVVEDPWLSVAVKVAVEVPAVGVAQVKTPVEVEKVAPEGSELETVIGSPSGSTIETVKLIAEHVVPDWLVGPVMTGGWFTTGGFTVVTTVLLVTHAAPYPYSAPVVRAVFGIVYGLAGTVGSIVAVQVNVADSPGSSSCAFQFNSLVLVV